MILCPLFTKNKVDIMTEVKKQGLDRLVNI